METIVIILYVLVATLLAVAILLQPGKGSGMGALGGGPAGGVFGARGAVPFLAKMTVYLGIAFGVLVLVLARMNIDRPNIQVTAPGEVAPATPGTDGAGAGAVTPTDGAAAPAPAEAPVAAPVEGAAAPAPAEAPAAAPAEAPAAAPAPAEAPAAAPADAPAPAEGGAAAPTDGE